MSDQIEREQQIEEESLTKNSLQIQKAAWIREELEKRRAESRWPAPVRRCACAGPARRGCEAEAFQ